MFLAQYKKVLFLFITLALFMGLRSISLHAQDRADDLILEDSSDLEMLMESIPSETALPKGRSLEEDFITSDEIDDLESLKEDIGSVSLDLDAEIKKREKLDAKKEAKAETKAIQDRAKKKKAAPVNKVIVKKKPKIKPAPYIFDVGKEEKELLTIAEAIGTKIPDDEWNDTVTKAQVSTYTVVKGDWLFKISKRLFGSGYFYPKIWSLNPFITNPHEIEPGMILTFSTGNSMDPPEIRLGKFSDEDYYNQKNMKSGRLADLPDDLKPEWLKQKEALKSKGTYFQYSSGTTIEDLDKENQQKVGSNEYMTYDPPEADIYLKIPDSEYDKVGFDRHARVDFRYKEGFSINTFVSTNIVQDLGKIDASIKPASIHSNHDDVYVKFNDSLNVIPGDKFSIYAGEGKIKHKNSDRVGYRYTIRGHIKVMGVNDKDKGIYRCQIMNATSVIGREDRITVYTPKIDRLTTTFNKQSIDAIIIDTYMPKRTFISYGDIVYLDRGKADGVEMGNVFGIYGFKDRLTNKDITNKPTYKNGEVTVITLTDNFATALVTNSRRDFFPGDLATTKSPKEALRSDLLSNNNLKTEQLSSDELKKLDAELNLDNLNNNIFDKAQQIELTDEEMAELERKEREKSILTDGEQDLEALEGLEAEIDDAEKLLRESELDEDKLLEKESLDIVEKDLDYGKVESVEELEDEVGKKYLDEDLNSKENPYGLTEFDIEEIDELLNIEQPKAKKVNKAKLNKTQKVKQKASPEKKSEESDLDMEEIDDLLDIDEPASENAKSQKAAPEDDEEFAEFF